MTMIYHKDWNSNILGRTSRHTSQVFKSECRWKQSHPSDTLTQPFESLFLKTTELELTWVTNAPIDGKCFTGCFHCTLGNPHRLWHLHNPWKLVRGTWTRKNVKKDNSLLYHLLFNIKLWEFWVTFWVTFTKWFWFRTSIYDFTSFFQRKCTIFLSIIKLLDIIADNIWDV